MLSNVEFPLAEANKLNMKSSQVSDPDRTLDVGTKVSGLVSGSFAKLGYIPLARAVGQCEGWTRYRVEKYLIR